MVNKRKQTKLKSLSHGRPPIFKPLRSVSSKITRTLIRNHHTLEKQRAKAVADGDHSRAAAIAGQIEAQGGIETYQRASLTGQANDRGGDSSKILMDWLQPVMPLLKDQMAKEKPARMLEVGALSTSNACSRSRIFDVERIDLHSQAVGIKQQDFMERPLPLADEDRFDIISLSLVLNFVPDATGKGRMLLRTLKFLRQEHHAEDGLRKYLPSLFLVLPASCVFNSRYMDEARLDAIMCSLGYTQVQKKISTKLVYYLWRVDGTARKQAVFRKEEVRPGGSRNNFAIVLQ